MQTEQTSSIDTSEMVLQVCSLEEIRGLSENVLVGFLHLLEQKAIRLGRTLTRNEILGIKEIALEHVSHPALSALSKALPT